MFELVQVQKNFFKNMLLQFSLTKSVLVLQAVYAFPNQEDGVMLHFPTNGRWLGGTGAIKYTLKMHNGTRFMGSQSGTLLDNEGKAIHCWRSTPPKCSLANAIRL